MKPTKLQKRVIDSVMRECKYWKNSNDITSPTHYSDIDEFLFAEYMDDISEIARGELSVKLKELYTIIKNIERINSAS